MRKKRRERREKRHEQQEENKAMPEIDRRAMEKAMADLGRLLSEHKFDSTEEMNAFIQEAMSSGALDSVRGCTPLEKAQDIMYQAWDVSGPQRVRLAHKALSISEDCADAYVLLAEEAATSLEEVARFYEQGVQAGERALGPEAFDEDVGHFWGLLETRPYMRARAGLGQCLWMQGKYQEAIDHFWDLLRLNPNDNQGLRDVLINWLLEVGDNEGAQKLLSQYEGDGMATWRFSRALLLFWQEGTREEATACLQEAISHNPHVPAYLLGEKRLPKRLPPYMGFGDENEAIHYAVDAKPIWQKDREALAWLRETVIDMDI
jgi:tetratricopeptide (TPR) repeat protein